MSLGLVAPRSPCFALALACMFLFAAVACGRSDEAPERIVLIVVDTLRRDHLSPYGANVETPNIEGLARRGTVFENAYASFHMTSMSMGAIFSGRTPAISSGNFERSIEWNSSNWCGVARFGAMEGGACFPAKLPLLGEVMRSAGYTTIGVTSNAMLFDPSGFSRGFDEWREVPEGDRGSGPAVLERSWRESSAMRSAKAVVDSVDAALARRKSDRFFLYVHFMDVHDWAAVKLPYRETVETVDRGIGALLDRLDGEGLLEDAVVILTSDHGESLDEPHLVPTTPRHMGNPSFEPVLAVPLIVAGAEIEHTGPMIRSEGLFRILVRLAGGVPEATSDLERNELFITEMAYRTYRRGRFKSYHGRYDGSFRLVDLVEDPGELRDVAAAQPAVAAAHRKRVDQLTAQLAAHDAPLHEVSEEHLNRLRSLGYVE